MRKLHTRGRQASRLLGTSAALALLAAAIPAFAAEPGTADTATMAAPADEIIVTAQKREERLSDVPISITALTGDQLARQGVSNPADLAKVTPGFTFQRSTYGVPVFTIRGIGLYDTSTGTAPTVSVYVDQVPLPYLVMTQAAGLDVERVEVLKGPQGTLFGQNSTGGAINYIAAKPTPDLHAGVDLTYGRFNQFTVKGYISGPISETLGFRVAAQHDGGSGWQNSVTRPGDTLGRKDFTAGRLLLDWNPSDTVSVELSATGWQDKSETLASNFYGFRLKLPPPRGYTEATTALANRAPYPENARVADWDPNVDFAQDNWMYQFAARAQAELSDKVTLHSITSYARFSEWSPVDTDGTDFNNQRRTLDASIETFSQELRLSAEFGGTNATVGVNYKDDKAHELALNHYMGSDSGLGPFRYQKFDLLTDQQVKTYAAFASLDIPLTSRLTAQAGIRYTTENRDYQGCLADGGDGALAAAIDFVAQQFGGQPSNPAARGGCVTLNPTTFARVGLVTSNLKEDNLSWRFGLNFKPTDDTLLYANVTRGYKAGAYTGLPAVYSNQLVPVVQERVTAYEAGIKTSLADRRIDISAAGFYYDYLNKQILAVTVVPVFRQLPQLQNIPKSHVWGLEADVTVRPVDGLRIRSGATYIRSRIDQTYVASDPDGNSIDLRGRDFPNVPRWQVVNDAEYSFPVGGSLKGYAGVNISYRSGAASTFAVDTFTYRLKPYTLTDLRIGIGDAEDKWTAELWGRNVFNVYYWTNANHAVDALAHTPGMPATYGITLRGRF